MKFEKPHLVCNTHKSSICTSLILLINRISSYCGLRITPNLHLNFAIFLGNANFYT